MVVCRPQCPYSGFLVSVTRMRVGAFTGVGRVGEKVDCCTTFPRSPESTCEECLWLSTGNLFRFSKNKLPSLRVIEIAGDRPKLSFPSLMDGHPASNLKADAAFRRFDGPVLAPAVIDFGQRRPKGQFLN